LFHLEPFNREDACEVIDIIEHFQKKAFEKHGTHFVQASDEWYINAGRDFPEADRYDGFIQLENGVGMVRLLMDEFDEEWSCVEGDDREYEVSMVTGVLVYDSIKLLANRIPEKFPNVKVHLYKIINDFFGHRITVTGLLTGGDIRKQLTGKPLGQRLILPSNTLMADEPKFLDDVTLAELTDALQVDVCIVESSGADFLHAVIGDDM
jgi:NifB/MoaA-like Fe-S oxidoreductase